MKIFQVPHVNLLMKDNHFHFLPFEFEKKKWTIVNKMEDCDIVPVLFTYGEDNVNQAIAELKSLGHTNQTIIILNLFHLMDNEDNKITHQRYLKLWKEHLKSPVYMIHSNLDEGSNDCIFYDILWNREKAYYTEYNNFNLKNRAWSLNANKNMYKFSRFIKDKKRKIFLSPTRIYKDSNHLRIIYRSKLINFLENKNGFYSDHLNGSVLESQQGIEFNNRLLTSGGTWWPVSNKYYQSSYISIYVETILERDKLRSITEKTWDPLIQGHFILPFGYQGLIKDIKSYGFKFPSWIDYSYDEISNLEERWDQYKKEIDRILLLDIEEIDAHWQKDLELLKYNREVFFKKNYDSLYDKIILKLNS